MALAEDTLVTKNLVCAVVLGVGEGGEQEEFLPPGDMRDPGRNTHPG